MAQAKKWKKCDGIVLCEWKSHQKWAQTFWDAIQAAGNKTKAWVFWLDMKGWQMIHFAKWSQCQSNEI